MTLRLMLARPVRHLTAMRVHLIPAASLILAIPVVAPGCAGRDPQEETEQASHLTTCLRAGDGGPAARESFCQLLRFYPKPGVADACWGSVLQRKFLWQAWCDTTFRWHPW
jgi:hypothetical protein